MSANNSGRPSRDDEEEERNPFVAFRRFADDQLNAVFHGLSELPAALSDLRQRVETAEAAALRSFNQSYERATNPERRQIERRSDGDSRGAVADEDAHPTAVWDRASRNCPIIRTDPNLGSGVGSEDYAGAWSKALSRTDDEDRTPQDATRSRRAFELDPLSLFNNPWSWRPSIRYLIGSQYSPLRLEQNHGYVNWRDAFEDLLIEDASGQLLPPRTDDEYGSMQSSGDWVTSLISRDLVNIPLGFLGSSPVFSSPILSLMTSFMDLDVDHSEKSELDHYEQFLGKQGRSFQAITKRALVQENSESSQPKEGTTMPSIVATMTTTERHVLPDGTVTTKTVLKKRFADGREESEENTSTTHASPSSAPAVEQGQEDRSHVRAIGVDTKKNSWFWST